MTICYPIMYSIITYWIINPNDVTFLCFVNFYCTPLYLVSTLLYVCPAKNGLAEYLWNDPIIRMKYKGDPNCQLVRHLSHRVQSDDQMVYYWSHDLNNRQKSGIQMCFYLRFDWSENWTKFLYSKRRCVFMRWQT